MIYLYTNSPIWSLRWRVPREKGSEDEPGIDGEADDDNEDRSCIMCV